jgi:hypothetical protein
MTTRADITNLAGAPVPVETLTPQERRALDVLAEAGLIAPLAEPGLPFAA